MLPSLRCSSGFERLDHKEGGNGSGESCSELFGAVISTQVREERCLAQARQGVTTSSTFRAASKDFGAETCGAIPSEGDLRGKTRCVLCVSQRIAKDGEEGQENDSVFSVLRMVPQ